MELLEGYDLNTLVRRFGPLPPERAVFLLQQACHSLAEAHERGLIHRDVKPENIFVCRHGIDWILTCLEKDPENRPQSALELRGTLESIAFAVEWNQERARKWWLQNDPRPNRMTRRSRGTPPSG